MSGKEILRVENVSKSFLGVKAIDRVSLTVEKGSIHAVIGENGAGKSTLMNVIFGMLERDEGKIYIEGKEVHFTKPADAIAAGVFMIHQETRLVQPLSVSENIWLGSEKQFMKRGFLDNKTRDAKTRELLKTLGLDIKPSTLIKNCSVAQMQLVEVARAVASGAKIIIMDEPTSALSDKEVQHLFDITRKLATDDVAIIYISHKLEEIYMLCDKVSIYRDGRYISTNLTTEITHDELIHGIVGRQISEMFPKETVEIGEPVLEVKDLCRNGVFRNISFKVHKGEILGISGLAGAGRSEVAQAIFGIDKLNGGKIFVEGREVNIHKPADAVRLGLGMVTEDRLRMGIIAMLSVRINTTIVSLKNYCKKFLHSVKRKKEVLKCREYVDLMQIKVSDINQRIDSLSGGNQQKVILARWIMNHPKVLILDEPTRGIDVGSKSEIHRLISKFVKEGMAIILISSEMPELIGIADRILVMREGNLVYECPREEATQELLAKYALG